MRLLTFLLCATLAIGQQQWPLHDNGLNEVVQWDRYSLMVNGQRLYMWSGEFHYFRIPVPELWIDILEKIKAAGFNTISLYASWGWHSASEGQLDFETGAHNFSRIFDIAKDLGLYVLFRPGPYINAETNAGGFPGWLTTGQYGTLRNNDSRYTDAWTPYLETISKIVAEHSIVKGGNVMLYQLENEYGQQWTDITERTPNETAIHYMELLEAAARRSGIDMPTLANNPNLGSKSWSLDYDVDQAGGDTDIYSVDNYPSCWSCDLSECTSVNGFPPNFTTFDYYTNFQETAWTQPSILAEFQGGSYNPWSGPQGGCSETTGPDWVNVFYRNNIGNKVTGVNLYMLFGGTNWGGLPMPTVGTSYDYSAPISEARLIGKKYHETKLLGYFLRAAKDLTKVEKIANGTVSLTGSPDVFAQGLRHVDTGSRFWVVKHSNTTLETRVSFRLNMTTSLGSNLVVPQYAPETIIDGRQAKILVADFAAGDEKLIYSTAEVLTVSVQNKKTIIILWVPTGESGEFYLEAANNGSVAHCEGCANVHFHKAQHGVIVSFLQNQGMTVLAFDTGARVLLVDRTVAYTIWQPTLSNDPHAPLDETIVVRGPSLVRRASLEDGTIALTGDYDGISELEVFAPPFAAASYQGRHATKLTFNGKLVDYRETDYGSLQGYLTPSAITEDTVTASIPSLSSWKFKDALPESAADYDDSGKAWVHANKMTTANPRTPDTFPVLYADEYGFHAQNVLWRGRFNDNGSTIGIFLNVIGGTSSGWSAWLNGVYLGSILGDTSLPQTNLTLLVANITKPGENVLVVLQDNMGHDQTTGVLNPRGILNATLIGGGNFTSWFVAGKAGGQANIDPVRGPYNEGGLHAERVGWHLPGFDDSTWDAGSPEDGLRQAGVNFYRTTLPLALPEGHDVSLAFNLQAAVDAKLRAQLYVNGYNFGKFIPHIGHQTSFPVFPGILDYHGNNTIGLSIWAQDANGASVNVSMSVLSVQQSSFDPGFEAGYLRPGWTAERLAYY